MNNTQQTLRVGLFFLLGVALVWVTFETLGSGKIWKDKGYTLVAGFDNLRELKVGDEVRMAGVKIGAVEKTRLANRRAEAVLRIDPKIKVPSDSVATISMAGLIGTNYIGVELGSPNVPPLAPGDELRTKVTPDLNTIMTQLGDLGQKLQGALGAFGNAMNGNGEEDGGLFQKLDRLVGENSGKINATMSNLQEITAKINQGEGTLGKLVNDPALHDELLATLGQIRGAADEAKTFVANAQDIVTQVKSGHGTLGTLLYDESAGDDFKALAKNLREVSDKLARGEGTLGKLINDDTLYSDARGTLKKADRALDSMSDAGPVSAVGVLANALF